MTKTKCLISKLMLRLSQAIDGLYRAYQFYYETLFLHTSRVHTHTHTRPPTGCETKVSHKLVDIINGKTDRRTER